MKTNNDVVEVLTQRALRIEKQLARTAQQLNGDLRTHRKAQAARRLLEKLASDGHLTPSEFDALREVLAALGLDETELAHLYADVADGGGSLDSAAGNAFAEHVKEGIDLVTQQSGRSMDQLSFSLQLALGAHSTAITKASEVSKARHDAYLQAIKNLA